jgi:hypothetical protein
MLLKFLSRPYSYRDPTIARMAHTQHAPYLSVVEKLHPGAVSLCSAVPAFVPLPSKRQVNDGTCMTDEVPERSWTWLG